MAWGVWKRMLTDSDIVGDAIGRHPDCKYGQVVTGMNTMFQLTRVVRLWPDEYSYNVGNKAKYEVEGYPFEED